MPFGGLLIASLVGGAASLAGSAIAADSASKGRAVQEAAAAKVDEYGRPYREAGTEAQGRVNTALGLGPADTLDARRAGLSSEFESSPLYKYTYQPAVDEATKAAERNASAGGYLNSGRLIKAIQDRAARIGGMTFGNYLGDLTDQANRGQQAAFGSADDTQQSADKIAQGYENEGDAIASGVVGVGKAVTGGIDNSNYLKGLSAYRNDNNALTDLRRTGSMY